MAKYSKEDIPNLDSDTLFKVGMNLANKLVSSKLGGMTWDDLPDTNSLWDYIDEGMSAEDFIQGIKDAVDDRISSEMDDMGMDSELFESEGENNNLSPKEQAILKDILGESGIIDEGFFDSILEKVKSYVKKGMMTAGILAALLSTPGISNAQSNQLKQIAKTEMSVEKSTGTDISKMSNSEVTKLVYDLCLKNPKKAQELTHFQNGKFKDNDMLTMISNAVRYDNKINSSDFNYFGSRLKHKSLISSTQNFINEMSGTYTPGAGPVYTPGPMKENIRRIVRKLINEEIGGPIVDVDGVSGYFVNKIKREGENYIEIKDEIIKTARGDKSVVKDIFSAIGKKLKLSGDKKLYSIGQAYDSDMLSEMFGFFNSNNNVGIDLKNLEVGKTIQANSKELAPFKLRLTTSGQATSDLPELSGMVFKYENNSITRIK